MNFLTGNGSWVPAPHVSLAQPEVHHAEGKNVFLFNIHDDPNEHHDLSDKHPDVVKKLLVKLSQYQATAVPPCYPKPDPRCNPALHGNVWLPWE